MFAARGRSADDIGRTSTAEYFRDKPQAAVRPLKSVLDLTKITGTGFRPRDWHTALDDYLAHATSRKRCGAWDGRDATPSCS